MRRRGPEESERSAETTSWDREVSTPPPSAAKGELTVIGTGARLEGTLISAASLRIEGSVKGQITAEGDVIVAPGSEVAADIRASNVTIGGRYTGNVTAAGTLELQNGAHVEGNVSCQSLVVNQGAIFSGQSIMEGQPSSSSSLLTREESLEKSSETSE